MSFFHSRQLKIKAKTWARDSTGLYDHEDTEINVQSLTVKKPCNISRANHHIIKEKPSRKHSQYDGQGTATESNEESAAILATVTDTPVGIQILPTAKDGEDIEKGFWRVVEKGKDAAGTILKAEDIIRLGRTTFKVIKIKTVEDGMSFDNQYQNSLMNDLEVFMKDELTTDVLRIGSKKISSSSCCRICLSDTLEPNNPFVSPCNCIGTVKYVHLECLQHWVKCRLNMQMNGNIITLMWKNLHCELCKEKLPLHFVHEGKELSLIPINKNITGSYVVLESFAKDSNSLGIHVIDLGQNHEFKIGRGTECDLKIQDISVSRVHASLIVSKGKLYIRDNISKFGTLVLQKYPIVICDENPKSCWIQCGRSMFQFSIKKSWVLMLPWCSYSGFGMNSIKSKRSLKKMDYNMDRQTQLPYNEQEELQRSAMMV